jgi:hypothetical protein
MMFLHLWMLKTQINTTKFMLAQFFRAMVSYQTSTPKKAQSNGRVGVLTKSQIESETEFRKFEIRSSNKPWNESLL